MLRQTLVFCVILLSYTAYCSTDDQDSIPKKILTKNRSCLRCHNASLYSYFDESLGMQSKGRMKPEFRVHKAQFYQSNHKNLACVDCHLTGYDDFPHPDKEGNKLTCLGCHKDSERTNEFDFVGIDTAYQQSIHHIRFADQFSCVSCHNPHSYAVQKDTVQMNERISYDNAQCLMCHENAEVMRSFLNDSVYGFENHAWLPNQALHFSHVRCVDCHSKINEGLLIAHQVMPKDSAVRKCEACHSENSVLLTGLYKDLETTETLHGGAYNSVMLKNSYVIGAVGNHILNQVSVIIFFLVLAGILIHVLLRLFLHKKSIKSFQINPTPLGIRIWHWINEIGFILLIITGLSLHYPDASYAVIGFGQAVTLHNILGMIVAIGFVFYVMVNRFSHNNRFYKLQRKQGMRNLGIQFRFYLIGVFKKNDVPFPENKSRKFNPLQKVSYVMMMKVVMPLLVFSGLMLLFPNKITFHVFNLNGLYFVALIHMITGYFSSVFIAIHIYFSIFDKSVVKRQV